MGISTGGRFCLTSAALSDLRLLVTPQGTEPSCAYEVLQEQWCRLRNRLEVLSSQGNVLQAGFISTDCNSYVTDGHKALL